MGHNKLLAFVDLCGHSSDEDRLQCIYGKFAGNRQNMPSFGKSSVKHLSNGVQNTDHNRCNSVNREQEKKKQKKKKVLRGDNETLV